MVKDGIVKGLVAQANKIKDVYKEIGHHYSEELMKKLDTLLEEENLIYSCIPLKEYSDYLDYFIERQEMNPDDVLAFSTLSVDFNPEIRIIQKFLYNQEKVSMFLDTDEVPEDEKWQYLYNYEFFTNLLMYYSFFLKTHKEYILYFDLSYSNVLYHFPYAEAIFLKDKLVYNKEQLLKFSGLSNASSELDQEFASEIHSICSFLLEDLSDSQNGAEEEQTFSLEEPFTKLSLCMYLGALYYSIDNENFASALADIYKSNAVNEKQKEIFSEIALLVEHSFDRKRNLKRKEMSNE